MIESVENVDITVFDLFEDGTCYVEQIKDELFLVWIEPVESDPKKEDLVINLKEDFTTDGYAIKQVSNSHSNPTLTSIDLKEPHILEHFKAILKETSTNANQHNQT